MKNLKLGLALLAALALIFAAGCSDDDAGYEVIGGTYYVYTAKGLQAWADYVALGNYSTNCTLTADIDMQNASWTPVNSYSGTFDGDGHKVSNFAINSSGNNVGFFATISSGGTAKGLGLEDVTVTGGMTNVGGIAGSNEGTIIACYFTGSVEAETSGTCAGGIAGINSFSASTTACYYTNADDGVGDGTTKVDGSSGNTWEDAETAMNNAFDTAEVGWKYDGADDDTPPTLVKSDS